MINTRLLGTFTFAIVLGACGSSNDEPTGSTTSNITAGAYPQTQFVTALYETALGREPDKAGLDNAVQYLVTQGCTTQTLGVLVKSVLTSAEFKSFQLPREIKVQVLYEAALGREPDDGGYAFWLGKLQSGATFAQIIDGFTTSTEFASLTPSRCTP